MLRLLIIGMVIVGGSTVLGCGSTEPVDQEEPPEQEQPTPVCQGVRPGEWEMVSEGFPQGAVMSAWGPSKQEIYAVGGQPEQGVVWRWDGQQWTDEELEGASMVNWVHGAGETIYLVGSEGEIRRRRGGPWEVMESPVDVELWGVWAASEEDIWAVGGEALDANGEAVLLHFEGQSWTQVDLPELDRATNALFKVWGTGPDHVFAVGARGVILHFDGDQWRQVGSGTGEDFVSLWGRSADDIVAVGGRSNGIVARWDGEGFETQMLPGIPGLNGVWMDCLGVAHINGIDGVVITLDQGGWEPTRQTTPTTRVLHAMFGVDGVGLLAVGGTLLRSPPYEGTLLVSGDFQ